MTILVVGASGATGIRLVEELVNRKQNIFYTLDSLIKAAKLKAL